MAFTTTLSAATVAGRVDFLTKRGQHPIAAETLVWLEPAGSTRVSRIVPGSFEMVTRNKMLIPHVMAIPAGSTVTFPNDDPISHNLFSLSSGNDFDLGLYRRGKGKSRTFDSPGTVVVYCNVHPSMSAVIQVMDTPYYAFAASSGVFSIPEVPAGHYRLIAWNEQSGQIETPIDVTASGTVRGESSVLLDSRNYRLTQHLNKLGKPYQPPRDY
ncbi:MAG TPA: hypothetical protein VKH35_09200 [Thermoanaerobaculia bacterium]|nr:hypothetical protein [Thermoanaerobaculia bacterium]